MTISELKNGARETLTCLVSDVQISKTRKNTDYYRLTLKDQSGSVPAVWWTPDLIVESGCVYLVGLDMGSYNDSPQATIQYMQKTTASAADFQPKSVIALEVLWDRLVADVATIEDGEIRKLVEDVLLDPVLIDKIKRAPAGKSVHQPWVGGLMEHTCNMLIMAKALLASEPVKRLNLNKDIILAGIALHDLGKVIEYDLGEKFGETTVRGELEGHISWIYNLIGTRAKNTELKWTFLKHVVLSHHGKLEFGSPVVPKTLEAMFVHQIDMLDSSLWSIHQHVTNDKSVGDFTNRCYVLDRKLYKPR